MNHRSERREKQAIREAEASSQAAQPDPQHELPRDGGSSAPDAVNEQGAPATREPSSSAADLQQLRTERDSLVDRLARSQAEFENARKRMARDEQSYRELAFADALKTILPVLDSFDWALAAPPESLQQFHRGVELIRNQLDETLKKLGVRPVPAEGEAFDPHLHEAIDVVENADAADNHVVRELRRGYKLGDRLLRPAMVSVARKSAA
jgi:molecular chaperone GrpE